MLADILTSPWLAYVLGGFAANGFITQAVAITPTKKDDQAVSVIGQVVPFLFKTLTGTHGLQKK